MNNTFPHKFGVHTHNWVTYLLVRLFCRRDDRRIAYSLYRYFRQCDDYIDDPDRDQREKLSFLDRQRRLIDKMYNGHLENDSQLAVIINYDRRHHNAFKNIFYEMLDIFEFDAQRGNKASGAKSLIDYSLKLSHAYTTLLIMFLKPEHKINEQDIQLAHGCHLVHMLRDYYEDQKLGYLNISREEKQKFVLDNPDSENFRQWVKERISFLDEKLKTGKKSLIRTPYIRIRLIALLYCFRYEIILKQLKDNGYILKRSYPMRIKDMGCLIKTLFSIVFQGITTKFAII